MSHQDLLWNILQKKFDNTIWQGENSTDANLLAFVSKFAKRMQKPSGTSNDIYYART